jgi:hypothetical protein
MESFRKPPTVMIVTKNRAPVIASAGNVVERVWVEDSQRASHSAVPYSGAGSQVQRSRFDPGPCTARSPGLPRPNLQQSSRTRYPRIVSSFQKNQLPHRPPGQGGSLTDKRLPQNYQRTVLQGKSYETRRAMLLRPGDFLSCVYDISEEPWVGPSQDTYSAIKPTRIVVILSLKHAFLTLKTFL